MNVNLRFPPTSIDKQLITFSLFESFNSIRIFLFELNTEDSTTTTFDSKSKLVSGYENSTRAINMNLSIDNILLLTNYYIDCFRLPFVSMTLITSDLFDLPLNVLMVKTNNETQWWHILAIRKQSINVRLKKIIGVSIYYSNQIQYYQKDTIRINGNIPNAFVTAMSTTITNPKNYNQIKFIYPETVINSEPYLIHYN